MRSNIIYITKDLSICPSTYLPVHTCVGCAWTNLQFQTCTNAWHALRITPSCLLWGLQSDIVSFVTSWDLSHPSLKWVENWRFIHFVTVMTHCTGLRLHLALGYLAFPTWRPLLWRPLGSEFIHLTPVGEAPTFMLLGWWLLRVPPKNPKLSPCSPVAWYGNIWQPKIPRNSSWMYIPT